MRDGGSGEEVRWEWGGDGQCESRGGRESEGESGGGGERERGAVRSSERQ